MGTPSSNRRTTASGNFRFLPEVTAQNTLSPTEEITSKAPKTTTYSNLSKRHLWMKEGLLGGKFVLDQVHGIFENLCTVNPTMVIYPFPGKIQHSKHVMPYERKHTRVPQSKRYRKIASLPELKRYTDRVLVYTTKCSFINVFLGHTMPMDQLMNADVEYQVVNDQMRIIVKDVQAPASTTAAWLVGMDPVSKNCLDLAETLCGYS